MYMAGLDTSFSDLPNTGHNLRLYTYDPPGSKYGPGSPSGGVYVYNTGHYDISLPGGPCSQADPQGFMDWQSMSAYASGRGESLVLVSRDDLTVLCNARPVAPTITPPSPAPGPITTIIGARPLPTTPTGINVPVSVYTPGTGPTVIQPGAAPAQEQSSFLPWIAAAAAAALSLLG